MRQGLRLVASALLASIALGHLVSDTTPKSALTWWLVSTSSTLESLAASNGLGVLFALAVTRWGLTRPARWLAPLRSMTRVFGLVPVLLWCAALTSLNPRWVGLALVVPLGVALGLELSLGSLAARGSWQHAQSDPASHRHRVGWRTAVAEVAEHANLLTSFVPRALGIHAAVSLLDNAPRSASWGQQLGAGLRDGFDLRTVLALLGLGLSCWTVREAVPAVARVAGFAAWASPSRSGA